MKSIHLLLLILFFLQSLGYSQYFTLHTEDAKYYFKYNHIFKDKKDMKVEKKGIIGKYKIYSEGNDLLYFSHDANSRYFSMYITYLKEKYLLPAEIPMYIKGEGLEISFFPYHKQFLDFVYGALGTNSEINTLFFKISHLRHEEKLSSPMSKILTPKMNAIKAEMLKKIDSLPYETRMECKTLLKAELYANLYYLNPNYFENMDLDSLKTIIQSLPTQMVTNNSINLNYALVLIYLGKREPKLASTKNFYQTIFKTFPLQKKLIEDFDAFHILNNTRNEVFNVDEFLTIYPKSIFKDSLKKVNNKRKHGILPFYKSYQEICLKKIFLNESALDLAVSKVEDLTSTHNTDDATNASPQKINFLNEEWTNYMNGKLEKIANNNLITLLVNVKNDTLQVEDLYYHKIILENCPNVEIAYFTLEGNISFVREQLKQFQIERSKIFVLELGLSDNGYENGSIINEYFNDYIHIAYPDGYYEKLEPNVDLNIGMLKAGRYQKPKD